MTAHLHARRSCFRHKICMQSGLCSCIYARIHTCAVKVHATIERSSGEEWSVYVGDERRVTVVRRVVANNTVFLVCMYERARVHASVRPCLRVTL